MRPGATAIDRFDAWFTKPIAKLKELPDGDAGYAVLMIAFPLYERYILAKLNLENKGTDEANIKHAMATDLGLNDSQRSIFWDMCRNGFLHAAMAKSGKTLFMVSDRFGGLPTFVTLNGCPCVGLDPWKFAERVIARFKANPELITVSESFPLANVIHFKSASKSISGDK